MSVLDFPINQICVLKT